MRESVLFGLDCFAILLVTSGLWLAYRHKRSGLMAGAIGIALLSGMTAYRAYPVPTRAALQRASEELKLEFDKVTNLWRTSTAQAERLQGELETKRHQLGTCEDSRREAEEKIAITRAEVTAQLRLVSLLISMASANGISNDLFELKVLPRELIAGKTNLYLVVRLKNKTGSEFIFPKGEYKLPAEQIRKASEHVILQLDPLLRRSGVKFNAFFRGGATSENWISPAGAGAEFGPIAYRRVVNEGQYGDLSTPAPFGPRLDNKDLPLLRAAFFRSVVAPELLSGELLHKPPSSLNHDSERTVELILYVEPTGG